MTKLYKSTKTYGHEQGLSCAFRQWRADSHCNLIHGYALSVSFEFTADSLDARNWVVDFGGLSEVKEWLKETFDHTTLVAKDDPNLSAFKALDEMKMIDLVLVDNVGCEAFAEYIHHSMSKWLKGKLPDNVMLTRVEVREHGANSAIVEVPYKKEQL